MSDSNKPQDVVSTNHKHNIWGLSNNNNLLNHFHNSSNCKVGDL